MSNTAVIAVKTMMGYKVENEAGEDLGRIEDLIVDQSGGRIMFGVMSCGGFLGIGSRLIAVPWNMLTFDSSTGRFNLNLDKETLLNAPSFNRDDFTDLTDREWQRHVQNYFAPCSAIEPDLEEAGTFSHFRGSLDEPAEEFIESNVLSISRTASDDDEKLARRVEFELYSTRAVDLEAINVMVRNGVATLSGRVHSSEESDLAHVTAQGVKGIRSVTNNLKVSKAA
jgi:hypothetical protein